MRDIVEVKKRMSTPLLHDKRERIPPMLPPLLAFCCLGTLHCPSRYNFPPLRGGLPDNHMGVCYHEGKHGGLSRGPEARGYFLKYRRTMLTHTPPTEFTQAARASLFPAMTSNNGPQTHKCTMQLKPSRCSFLACSL